MKLSVNQRDLQEELRFVEGFSVRKSPSPLLECVYIESDDQGLSLRTTDTLNTATSLIESSDNDGSGVAMVNAKDILDAVKVMEKGEDVRIEASEDVFSMSCAGANFRFTALDPASFPSKPLVDAEGVRIGCNELSSMCAKVATALGDEANAYQLTGASFFSRDQYVGMVATDGHRLHVVELDVDCPGPDVLVPGSVVHLMGRGIEEDAYISRDDSYVGVTIGRRSIVSRLLEGTFPDFERVISEVSDSSLTMTVNRRSLIEALRRLLVIADGAMTLSPMGKFSINGTGLRLESNTQMGSFSEDVELVDVTPNESEGNFWVNPTYVLDALRSQDTEEVKISLCDMQIHISPRSGGARRDLHLIMTIRPPRDP